MQIFFTSLVSVLMTRSEENISCIVQQGSLGREYFSKPQLRFQVLLEALGDFYLAEARGRGKTFAALLVMVPWFKTVSGAAPSIETCFPAW